MLSLEPARIRHADKTKGVEHKSQDRAVMNVLLTCVTG